MVALAETDKQKIKRTMTHLKDGYFKPFVSSLENLVLYVAECGKVFVKDTLTKHTWCFDLSLIEDMSNMEVRTFLVDFLLKETWENEGKSKFYVGKTPN